MGHNLEFTIILPVWHSENPLRNALLTLNQLEYRPDRFEVIVAGAQDDQCSRRIVEQLAQDSVFGLRFLGCANSQRANLLNAACREANGRILAFAADDCFFRRSWLRALHDLFSRELDLGVVGGPDDLEPSRSTFALAVNYALQSFFGTGGMRRGNRLRAGAYYPKLWNMAVSRQVAFEVALQHQDGQSMVFDESLGVHEDVEFARRVAKTGKRIRFSPDVKVGYKRDRTLGLFVRGNFQKARASRTLGAHRSSHLVLTTFVLCFLSLGVASLFSPLGKHLFCALSGSYCVMLTAAGIGGFFYTKRIKASILIPAILVSLHFARGIGYLFPLRK